jgi:hypothetical protein
MFSKKKKETDDIEEIEKILKMHTEILESHNRNFENILKSYAHIIGTLTVLVEEVKKLKEKTATPTAKPFDPSKLN